MTWGVVAAGTISAGVGLYNARQSRKGASSGGQQQASSALIDVEAMTGEQRAQFQNVLSSLVGRATTPSPQFSKEQAILDATYVANRAAEGVLRGVPQIVAQAGAGGAYSSTGSQALINDLAERATAVKAQTILGAISEYARIDQQRQAQDLSAVLQAFGLAQQATRKERKEGTEAATFSSATSGGGAGYTPSKETLGAVSTLATGAADFFSGRGGTDKYGFTPGVGNFDAYGSGDVPDLP